MHNQRKTNKGEWRYLVVPLVIFFLIALASSVYYLWTTGELDFTQRQRTRNQKNVALIETERQLEQVKADLRQLRRDFQTLEKSYQTLQDGYQKEVGDSIQTQLKNNQAIPASREILLPDSGTSMTFVYVKPGEFSIGLLPEISDLLIRSTGNPVYQIEAANPDKHPQRFKHGFLVGKYEVTHEQYQSLRKEHQFSPPSAKLPVTGLPDSDIGLFCEAFDEGLPQISIGLPTEKEWEYAAKGASLSSYTWGSTFEKDKANVNTDQLVEVGKNPAGDSWCGASDMIGNAAEVCVADTENYRQETSQTLVARGGSYKAGEQNSRTTSRHTLWTTKSGDIGFRIVIRLKASVPMPERR